MIVVGDNVSEDLLNKRVGVKYPTSRLLHQCIAHEAEGGYKHTAMNARFAL